MTSAERARRFRERQRRDNAQRSYAYIEGLVLAGEGFLVVEILERQKPAALRQLRSDLGAIFTPATPALPKPRTTPPKRAAVGSKSRPGPNAAKGRKQPAAARRRSNARTSK